MSKRNRIICSYTKREWILIEHQIKLLGKKSVLNYLMSEIKMMDTEFENLTAVTSSFSNVEKRQYYPPDETQEILEKLSKKMNIPPSTLVSRLLLTPLLNYSLII